MAKVKNLCGNQYQDGVKQSVISSQESFNHQINAQVQKYLNKKQVMFLVLLAICLLIIGYFCVFKSISEAQTKDIGLLIYKNQEFNQNEKKQLNKYQNHQNKNIQINSQQSKNSKQLIVLQHSKQQRMLIPQQFFCIIIQSANQHKNTLHQFKTIRKQNYQKWKAIFYVSYNYQTLLQKLKHPQTRILQSYGNIGKNIYNGIVNECPQHSIIITLKDNEFLNNINTLTNIYTQLSSGDYNIALSSFKLKDKVKKPNYQIKNFQRNKYFKLHQRRTDLSLIKQFLSHIRIFKSSNYFRVPYIQLMYENQTFIESELAYILPIFEINFEQHTLISKTILYNTNQKSKNYNQDTINAINFIGNKVKFPTLKRIMFQMNRVELYRQPKLWSTNKKLDILKRNISQSQKLIPQIIHQIWVGPQIPEFKKKFMSRFKELMPEYQYKLWTNQNITKQNFPFIYQYILNLQQLDKTSQYSKQSMIADLMKIQVVYHYGGFYYDTNYQPFRSIQHLRHYPFVGVNQLSVYFGEDLAACFFGAQKNSIYLQKLLRKQMLDKINYNSIKVNLETGPYYLAKPFTFEDYYYKVKILTPQIFFPYLPWSHDSRRMTSLCSFSKMQEIPKQLNGTYKQIIQAKQFYLLFPCKNQYMSQDYGIDHLHVGATWRKKRNMTTIKNR